MPPSRRFPDLRRDEGSAALEFITAGLILLLPLVYLVLAMATIQAGALSVEGASRQAARVFVESTSPTDARVNARTAVEFALADYGLDPEEATITISCRPRPNHCFTRRGFVTIRVRASVTLPLVPDVLAMKTPVAVPLDAVATQQVSRFWGAG